MSQAIKLKKLEQEGILNEQKIEEILQEKKPNQKEFIKIDKDKIEKYIPSKVKKNGKIEEFIIKCIKEHFERKIIKNTIE